MAEASSLQASFTTGFTVVLCTVSIIFGCAIRLVFDDQTRIRSSQDGLQLIHFLELTVQVRYRNLRRMLEPEV